MSLPAFSWVMARKANRVLAWVNANKCRVAPTPARVSQGRQAGALGRRSQALPGLNGFCQLMRRGPILCPPRVRQSIHHTTAHVRVHRAALHPVSGRHLENRIGANMAASRMRAGHARLTTARRGPRVSLFHAATSSLHRHMHSSKTPRTQPPCSRLSDRQERSRRWHASYPRYTPTSPPR